MGKLEKATFGSLIGKKITLCGPGLQTQHG